MLCWSMRLKTLTLESDNNYIITRVIRFSMHASFIMTIRMPNEYDIQHNVWFKWQQQKWILRRNNNCIHLLTWTTYRLHLLKKLTIDPKWHHFKSLIKNSLRTKYIKTKTDNLRRWHYFSDARNKKSLSLFSLNLWCLDRMTAMRTEKKRIIAILMSNYMKTRGKRCVHLQY